MPSASSCGEARTRGPTRPRWELADIVRLHGDDYRRSHPPPLSHLKILRDIERCRTAALGGHLQRCDHCGVEKPAYNSCRNRHCPKCQCLAKARWREARVSEVLPVGYFHEVFALPHELNPLVLCNKAVLIGILFEAVAKTLQEFARDPRHLGGKPGFIAVLHTWDQKLMDHFHLHCVIPGGVLSEDGARWIPARSTFLFPVRALSRVFRGKYLELFKMAYAEGRLIFPGRSAEFSTPAAMAKLIDTLFRKEWIVYSKAPFAGPEKVLDYLSRYTHRVAISNNRILNVEDGRVTFAYRDRSDGNASKTMTLSAEEFLRRFLLHSLPTSFMRIRHFGFLANRSKKADLPIVRRLLGAEERREAPKKTDEQLFRELTGRDLMKCPDCSQGTMRVIAALPKILPYWSRQPTPGPQGIDSS